MAELLVDLSRAFTGLAIRSVNAAPVVLTVPQHRLLVPLEAAGPMGWCAPWSRVGTLSPSPVRTERTRSWWRAPTAPPTPKAPLRSRLVDVHGPHVDQVVAEHDGHAVVVPLLLAAGFHVHVDIARATSPWPAATASGALGPDDDSPRCSWTACTPSACDSRTRSCWRPQGPPTTTPSARCMQPPGRGRQHLLASGHVHHRVLAAGADVITQPLLTASDPDSRLGDLVLSRYEHVVRRRQDVGAA